MNDRAVELLEQYDIEVQRTRKGRGAIICDTSQGCMILKEYAGNQDRIELQNRLLKQVAQTGLMQAESIVPTKDGMLLTRGADGLNYILKTWQDGRECSIYEKSECVEAVKLLAKLHGSMRLPLDTPGIPMAFSPSKEYEKHNKELKKVHKYLKQKGQKTWFELNLLNTFDFFLKQALSVTEDWKEYSALAAASDDADVTGEAAFCHGDYQYHNILKGETGWFVVNFEKCVRDNPVRDLYLLLRKLLEKGNWSIALGTDLLEAYEKERPLSAMSRIDLYYRLSYPEKFWKIVNFYYNSGKAWIPGRNQEKLEKLIAQEKEKQTFLDEVFRNVENLRG